MSAPQGAIPRPRLRYNVCMRDALRFALVLLALTTLPATALHAADDALPPPSGTADTPATTQEPQAEESAPNLREEFKSNTPEDQVQVYSYQRGDGAKIEQYSMHGKVYMIKVQPPGGLPPYYLYDEDGSGHFARMRNGYKKPSPPMWVIKRF